MRHLLVGELVARAQAMDGAFELAPALGQPLGEEGEHGVGNGEPARLGTRFVRALRQDLVAKLVVHDADLGHEPAAKPRPHAHVELVELGRRPVRRHHHLPPAVDQRVQRVAELLLDGRPLQELHVVDEQNVDLAQLLLEGERVARAQGLHEARHEALGGEIEHLRLGLPLLHVPGNGVQQMGLAEAHAAVDEERVEQLLRRGEGACDFLRRGMREPVRGADQEGGEGQPRIERRAFESAIARAQRHGQRRRLFERRQRHRLLAQKLLRLLVAEMRLPHAEFDAIDLGPFGPRGVSARNRSNAI